MRIRQVVAPKFKPSTERNERLLIGTSRVPSELLVEGHLSVGGADVGGVVHAVEGHRAPVSTFFRRFILDTPYRESDTPLDLLGTAHKSWP